jgi:ribosomal protein S18 acetylase RimI-like enzyme
VTVGPAAAVQAALAAAELPERIFISARDEHYAPLATFYDFGDRAHAMWRMTPVDTSPVTVPVSTGLVRLNIDDSERLKQLYAHGGDFAPGFFEPYQLRDGVYFGVTGEDGALLAAGGTHILEREVGVAAIGNIYTRPDQRGNGYGSLVFQAIVATLKGENFSNIFLNVDQRNTTARKLYERHGFAVYCSFIEGTGLKRVA